MLPESLNDGPDDNRPMTDDTSLPAERARLNVAREWNAPWRKWGPYLSERQWGTVREDYSQDGNAWSYFPHDHARSRAYHWGEDGLAGFSDLKQRLCFALALWNGNDPILKERLFGLTNGEGNHGEDVKEYYFYLDSTPTHSYMKWLYKYPHAAFPYDDLIQKNAQRSRHDYEYELIDTGVFAEDRYFDVVVEYAKSSAGGMLRPDHGDQPRAGVGADSPAADAVVPQHLDLVAGQGQAAPRRGRRARAARALVAASHPELGERWLYCDGAPPLLFTENETNTERLVNIPNADALCEGRLPRVRRAWERRCGQPGPDRHQVRCALHLRRCRRAVGQRSPVPDRYARRRRRLPRCDATLEARRREADEFYRDGTPASASDDTVRMMRQAFAGLFWTKQYFFFDVNMWLREHGVDPFDSQSDTHVRNRHWFHMYNDDVISMPDKWEYPWYAAWDLAFHAVGMARVDPDFAKHQLTLMLKARYQHSNGQLPAYEWNFGDVNPPVHAWAVLFQFRTEQAMRGEGDVEFLKRAFGKLLINFTWWVNRKDRLGKSVFEGGFLGLDNIGVFDRSAELPTGGHLEQADGTAWMAMFCQNMCEIAIELAAHDPSYDDLVFKFAEHFLWIGTALNKVGDDGMWDEEDGFYYDVLRLPDGTRRAAQGPIAGRAAAALRDDGDRSGAA